MTVLPAGLLLDDSVCKEQTPPRCRTEWIFDPLTPKIIVLTSRLPGAQVETQPAARGTQTSRDKFDCNHQPAARRAGKKRGRLQ